MWVREEGIVTTLEGENFPYRGIHEMKGDVEGLGPGHFEIGVN